MTTATQGDNPDNALATRGTGGDSGMQPNGITQEYLEQQLARVRSENDRRVNAAMARAQQAEQVAYEANQRLAEYQEVSRYEFESEDEKHAAIQAMRSKNQALAKIEDALMSKRVLAAQSRSLKALSQAGIPWNYKHIDWAADAQTPEDVADRIIASIPYAREMLNREQSRARQTINQAKTSPRDSSEPYIQDTGLPSGSAPGGLLDKWGNMSREEREAARKLAKRRNPDGSSALRVEML